MLGIMQVRHILRPWPGLDLGVNLWNALVLDDARHASDILDSFALDLARLRTPEAVSSPFQAVPR